MINKRMAGLAIMLLAIGITFLATGCPTPAATPTPVASPTRAAVTPSPVATRPPASPTVAAASPTTAAVASPTRAAAASPTTAAAATPTRAAAVTPSPAAAPSGPPNIPHPTAGREACTGCHTVGGAGAGAPGGTGLPTSHQGRTDATCQGCHKTA